MLDDLIHPKPVPTRQPASNIRLSATLPTLQAAIETELERNQSYCGLGKICDAVFLESKPRKVRSPRIYLLWFCSNRTQS